VLFAMRVRLNSTYIIESLDSGYIQLSFPEALRPLQEMYHWIDEYLPDNCTQEVVLRYEGSHRGTDFIISRYKSRT
jgi:hypothetical protein